MKARRLLLALGTALLLLTLVAAGNQFRFWRDTIFHSTDGGMIELPSGHQPPTNQWLVFPADIPELGFLQMGDGRSGRQHLIQNHDHSHLATLLTSKDAAPAVVTDFYSVGPQGYREFWVGH